MDVTARALRMLSRREYGERELADRLVSKGVAQATAEAAVAELKRQDLVSDQRFAEALVHSRMQRGYGPYRIRQELRQRGVHDAAIDDCLDVRGQQWLVRLREVREKKFGAQRPGSYREWSQQAKFLQRRGFSAEQIHQVFPTVQQ